MTEQFSAEFLAQIVDLALQIARQVRSENNLQSQAKLIDKFDREREELAEAENPIEELVDLVYYATCLCAQGHAYSLWNLTHKILPDYPYTIEQLQRATRMKYLLRAASDRKDLEAERAAIQQALKGNPL